MTTSHPQQHPNFAILTPRLILVPTPLAISKHSYRDLYASLHRMQQFTSMAFGESWGIKDWDAETVRDVIGREVARSWMIRGMGDFAVGLRRFSAATGAGGKAEDEKERDLGWKAVQADEKMMQGLEEVEWIGYVGIRNATTTSMLNEPTAVASSRKWTEMVELRYGFHPDIWGKGYGTEAATAVMGWGAQEKGVERFIAETEKENMGSARVLGKLGFMEIDGREEVIWGMKGTREWQRSTPS